MAQIADSRALQLQISASTELLIRNLKTADQAVAAFRSQTEANLSRIDRDFAGVGKPLASLKSTIAGLGSGALAGLAGAAGAGSLISLAKQGLEYASSLQETAQQIGVNVEALQALRFAASQVGVSQEGLDQSLTKLTQTMGKAELGAKEPAKAFDALGISIDSIKGHTADEILPRIAEGLSRIGDPAQRAAIEIALFGRAGQQLDPLLSQGAAGIAAFVEQAKRIGLVLSAKQIQDADNAADKLAEVRQVLATDIARVVSNNANSIYTLADAIERVAAAASNSHAPLEGFYRIAQHEGVSGAVRSFFGNGDDQRKAATPEGYARLKIDQFKDARNDYVFVANHGGSPQAKDQRAAVAKIAERDARAAIQEWKDQVAAQNGARALARSQIVSGRGQAAKFLAPDAPKEPKGKSAEQLAAERDRNQKGYDSEEARAQDQLASVRAELANTADARLAIEVERINIAKTARDTEIADQAKLNPIVAAHADHLRDLNAQNAEAQKSVALARRDTTVAQNALTLRLAGYDDERDMAQAQANLALTIGQRRDAELRLLDVSMREEKDRLETERRVALRNNDQDGAAIAQRRLDSLPDRASNQRALIERQNAGPLDQYRNQLHGATDDINQALESVETRGFQSLEDGFAGVISGTTTVKQAFKEMAASIVADLGRILIERAILGAIGGGTSGGGGLFSGILGLLTGKKASGGPVSSGGLYLVGENGPELFAPGASGSIIPNHALRAPTIGSLAGSGGRGGEVTHRVVVEPNANFDMRVATTATGVVIGAAPAIIDTAKGKTMQALSRGRMPGGLTG